MARKTVGTGIIALVVLTLIYGLTAVMARFFSESVGVFEQWYIHFFIASVLTLVVFRRKIRLRAIMHAGKRDHILMAVRGLVGFVLAAGLYALATQHASIGSVAVMQVVPTTALFGWLILHERVSLRTLLLILLSFAGALLVVSRQGIGLHFGYGELLSLMSGVLFSLVFVLRKKQTNKLNNFELAFVTMLYGAAGNYIMAIFTTGQVLPTSANWSLDLGLLFIGAGVLSVAMSLLSNFGFEHVKATTASIILDMELVFGVILGYLFYRELLTTQQLIGASLILLSTVIIGYTSTRKQPVAPSPE